MLPNIALYLYQSKSNLLEFQSNDASVEAPSNGLHEIYVNLS